MADVDFFIPRKYPLRIGDSDGGGESDPNLKKMRGIRRK